MTNLPQDTKVFNFIENIDYTDTFSTELRQDSDIKDLYLRFVNTKSKTIDFLMSLRNKIMSIFGAKTVINETKGDFAVGNSLGLFKIYYIDEKEIISGLKDSHLDFCISFYKIDNKVLLSTLVKYNNTFGRVYMNIIKPFHKLIVKNMLKNLK
ncbi:DUF2867 domain-containing protein [bacterium]|jgi:hypothetical protein|nr:DUF2867 domain-containing protein [bacterium]